jgi:lipopolysaccharide biosynthesis glycosyltransferase
MIRIFIGYDTCEGIAYHVLSHSILRHASSPVSITPIVLSHLGASFHRERHALQSTDFAFSRFMVPWLCGYDGWAIFMDCDMLMLEDVARLWELRDEKYAVMCVKHNHVPKETSKFLGQPQTKYEKKNWSSVMLLNCGRCQALTPEYVNSATGLELHRFHWLENEDLIGALPRRWNHLVDYDPAQPADQLSLLHYTNGGPYFKDYETCGYADLWFRERDLMTTVLERKSRSAGS